MIIGGLGGGMVLDKEKLLFVPRQLLAGFVACRVLVQKTPEQPEL